MRRLLLALMLGAVCGVPAQASAALPRCAATHWVGAWAADPSDASQGSTVADLFDASINLKTPVDEESVRVILTPTLGGSTVRVRLSNRFGAVPVTFGRATIARRDAGAALVPGTLAPLTFGGQPSVTVAPGDDALSDAAAISFRAFQPLAVSVYVAGRAGMATEHYTGRQTSFTTLAGAGDHTDDTAAAAYVTPTTTRPFVAGLDVRAARTTGAVVAFGDSITDGYQGEPAGVPEVKATVDADGRWPDQLARRLRAADRPLSVINAGISGNRVLRDGAEGGSFDTYGPAALKRLGADVLGQSGVTTVIWLEGINDLGQSPGDPPAAIIAGYRKGIRRMHAAGLRVLQGTLTPSGTSSGSGEYATPETTARREEINTWIRKKSPADGVVDFDAAVRDAADPTRIAPAYDGSDGLHFNLAGYSAMADAIPLRRLRRPVCRRRAPDRRGRNDS